MDRIAEKSGVAVQTLYYTFRTKDSCYARWSTPRHLR